MIESITAVCMNDGTATIFFKKQICSNMLKFPFLFPFLFLGKKTTNTVSGWNNITSA
jgi:hypothetical protein